MERRRNLTLAAAGALCGAALLGVGTVAAIPPPPLLPGGNCTDYVDLTGLPLPIAASGNTAGASNDYDRFPRRPDCWENIWWSAAAGGPDVTFKWTCPASGRYTISLAGSSYDTCLELYAFTCPVEPVYPDDFICGMDDTFTSAWDAELFAMPFVAGQEILIVADGFGDAAGPCQLTISRYTPAADLDAFIAATMAAEHIPGLAACAVSPAGVTWNGAYGLAEVEHGTAVTDTTLFALASVSKPITGSALMQLWEAGRFQLDDAIDGYLPFPVRNPQFPDSALTIRMLLTHSSSINDNWDALDTLVTWGGDSPLDLRQFLEGYLTPGGATFDPASFNDWPPGAHYDYSNVGATLAGYLAQRIAGAPFATLCQDSLFAPLGMHATAWFLAPLDSSAVAVPYRWDGGAFVRYPHWGTPFYPASQLRTSAAQLGRFLAAFMNCGELEGARILDCPTTELMTTVQDPAINVEGGLLWYRTHYGGRFLWGHAGSYYGCITSMFFNRDENTGVVVLTNGEAWAPVSLISHVIFEHLGATTAVGGGRRGRRTAPPLELTVFQNRPNPFNPSTALTFRLSRPARVKLAVYDALGRQVTTLVDGLQQAGAHRALWHAAGVGSGIYFARLESGSSARTIKLVLVK